MRKTFLVHGFLKLVIKVVLMSATAKYSRLLDSSRRYQSSKCLKRFQSAHFEGKLLVTKQFIETQL